MTDHDDPTLGDVLDRLTDVAGELWALVDAITPHIHAADPGSPRRVELRAVSEYTVQGWAHAQTAAVSLRAQLALDAARHPITCPGCPDCQGIPVGPL